MDNKNINYNYAKNIMIIAEALAAMEVPFSLNRIYDGMQLRFSWCNGDVACHYGTYGSDEGYVETFEFPWDDGDVTKMKPYEAIAHILNLFAETSNPQKN